MGWPQIVMIGLFAANLTINLIKHGDKRTDHYNFGTAILGIAIESFLLYYGGFWKGD